MRMFLYGVAAVCTIAAAAPADAQTVDELVGRHIEARGGYDRLRAIETLRITRTVATPFSDVKVILYKKRPNFYRAEQGPTDGSAPLVPRGVNSTTAWDTIRGRIELRPEAAAAEARELDGDFDGLLVDWRDKGHTVTYEGREKLPSGDTHKLKVRTKSGAERIIYLDATTYLERRQTGVLNLPGGRQFDVVIDFGNYQEVNGVKFAYDINEDRTGKEPSLSYVTYTEKIEANVPMDDALFAPPAPAGK
jgi:hypothetical protein